MVSGAIKMIFSTLAKTEAIHGRRHNKNVDTRISSIAYHARQAEVALPDSNHQISFMAET